MRVMELHSPVRIVSRSKGQSSTAASAYRSGTRIECERTGEIHDYTKKQGVEFETIMIPEDAPEDIDDRKSLWNSLEKRERRKDSQLARDIEISFPSEFSFEQRREAAFQIGAFLLDKYSTGVDACLHQPSRQGDQRNYHLHILIPTRSFEDGDWKKIKDCPLEPRFGINKSKEELIRLRQGIADTMNNIAARDNVPVYVEHLSFEKRGIDREPLKPMSKEAISLERKGIKIDIGNINREIKKRNADNMKKSADLESQNDPYRRFYEDTQNSRRELLNSLETQYGEKQKVSSQELARLYQIQEKSNWFISFWRMVTGQAQKDKEKIQELQNDLQDIHQKKQKALEFFEKDRQKRLEAVQEQEQEQSQDEILDEKEQRRITYLERQQQLREMEQSRERGFER